MTVWINPVLGSLIGGAPKGAKPNIIYQGNPARLVVLDTETTGFTKEDRVVEIAGVEIKDFKPTGRIFHTYLNPQIPIPKEVTKIHGIGNDFASLFRRFAGVGRGLLDFLGDSPLVAHNAAFDQRMIDQELERLGQPKLANEWIDTQKIFKQLHPGSPFTLDGVCAKYKITNRRNGLHGALVDALMLADAYWHMTSGATLALVGSDRNSSGRLDAAAVAPRAYPARSMALLSTPEERAAHKQFRRELRQ